MCDAVDGVVVREGRHARATADQAPQDVLLDTAVDHGHVKVSLGRVHVERSLGADPPDEIDLLRVDKGLVLVGIVLLADGDAGKGGSAFAQEGDDCASVDSRDGRNTLPGTPIAETLDSSPVAVLLRDIADHHTGGLHVRRLEVFQETVLVASHGRDAVVPDQGLGEYKDLASIGWVRERLWITDQRRGEHGLARRVRPSTEGLAAEDGTILTKGQPADLANKTLKRGGGGGGGNPYHERGPVVRCRSRLFPRNWHLSGRAPLHGGEHPWHLGHPQRSLAAPPSLGGQGSEKASEHYGGRSAGWRGRSFRQDSNVN